uniref:Zer-1-like leucine-rich repeats region domain-containing protein n=1 Tax=Timema douglasi TaxID=61478 RepID=A0A7R8VX87_TIMDO|nr:unnamed protein product [Timema douglasi]
MLKQVNSGELLKLHEYAAFSCNRIRHLDISQVVEKHGVYRCENHTLAMLVENLPSLVSLDISGTNLAGTVLGYGHTCDLAAVTKTSRQNVVR